MKRPEYKQMKVPSLDADIKKMNGKSSHKLSQCIDELSDLLDESNEVQNEEADDKPQSSDNTTPE